MWEGGKIQRDIYGMVLRVGGSWAPQTGEHFFFLVFAFSFFCHLFYCLLKCPSFFFGGTREARMHYCMYPIGDLKLFLI